MPVITQKACQRCDHKWYPKRPGRPHVCPKCHSALWDKPKEPRDKAVAQPLTGDTK